MKTPFLGFSSFFILANIQLIINAEMVHVKTSNTRFTSNEVLRSNPAIFRKINTGSATLKTNFEDMDANLSSIIFIFFKNTPRNIIKKTGATS
jgi:hypothetical protein